MHLACLCHDSDFASLGKFVVIYLDILVFI